MQEHNLGAAEVTDEQPTLEQVATDLAALVTIEGELGALDAALRRLDDGSYWSCEACGEEIDEVVLAEAPLRRRCSRCAPPDTADLLPGVEAAAAAAADEGERGPEAIR
jgi:RNA polymerase-binding transcription factor DksA